MTKSAGAGRAEVTGVRIAWGVAADLDGRRGLSRELLRELLDGGENVSFSQVCSACGGPHGQVRATIDGEPRPLVSVSYADRLTVVGVAPQGSAAFGIDVERDQAQTRRAVHEAIGAADVTAWTRLEAAVKARGTGLRGPLPAAADDEGLSFSDLTLALPDGATAVVSVALG